MRIQDLKFKIQRLKINIFLMVLFSVLLPIKSFALQTVVLSEGASPAVEISHKDLNLIKFPFSDVKVYTNSNDVDIKIHGSDVFINVLGEITTDPINVFFVTPHGTFSMILVPRFIPSETILVRVDKHEIEDAIQWERDHDYISGIKELIKAMYRGVPPHGVRVSEVDDKTMKKWREVALTKKSVYLGATLNGEVYEAVNISSSPVRMIEREFYEEGVLAVSIDKHELSPSEKTNIYIVRKSQTQRRIESTAEKSNPLQILRQRGK